MNKLIEELEKYRKLGTLDQMREVVDKQKKLRKYVDTCKAAGYGSTVIWLEKYLVNWSVEE